MRYARLNVKDSECSGGRRHPRLNLQVIQCQKGPAAGPLRSEYVLPPCAVVRATEELCTAYFPTVTDGLHLLMKYPRECFSVHVECYQPAANQAQFHQIGRLVRHKWAIALAELALLVLLLLLIQAGGQNRFPVDSSAEETACLIRDCRWSAWYALLPPLGQRLEQAQ